MFCSIAGMHTCILELSRYSTIEADAIQYDNQIPFLVGTCVCTQGLPFY